jgi:hypothetical protein
MRGARSRLYEIPECLADLLGRVFLQEMDTGYTNLFLIGPCLAKLEYIPFDNRSRIAGDQEFGNGTTGHDLGVLLNDSCNIGGLSVDRYLARPDQGRPSIFWSEKRLAVGSHLLLV